MTPIRVQERRERWPEAAGISLCSTCYHRRNRDHGETVETVRKGQGRARSPAPGRRWKISSAGNRRWIRNNRKKVRKRPGILARAQRMCRRGASRSDTDPRRYTPSCSNLIGGDLWQDLPRWTGARQGLYETRPHPTDFVDPNREVLAYRNRTASRTTRGADGRNRPSNRRSRFVRHPPIDGCDAFVAPAPIPCPFKSRLEPWYGRRVHLDRSVETRRNGRSNEERSMGGRWDGKDAPLGHTMVIHVPAPVARSGGSKGRRGRERRRP